MNRIYPRKQFFRRDKIYVKKKLHSLGDLRRKLIKIISRPITKPLSLFIFLPLYLHVKYVLVNVKWTHLCWMTLDKLRKPSVFGIMWPLRSHADRAPADPEWHLTSSENLCFQHHWTPRASSHTARLIWVENRRGVRGRRRGVPALSTLQSISPPPSLS